MGCHRCPSRRARLRWVCSRCRYCGAEGSAHPAEKPRRSSIIVIIVLAILVYLAADITGGAARDAADRKSTRLNSSHSQISYAVFCLKKKKDAVASAARALVTGRVPDFALDTG